MSGKVVYAPVYGSALRYARENSGYSLAEVQQRFPDILLWEEDYVRPTMAQAKSLAKFYRRTLAFFYLRAIPEHIRKADELNSAARRQQGGEDATN